MWLMENNYAVSTSGLKVLKSNESRKRFYVSLGPIEYELELKAEYSLNELIEALDKIENDDARLTREKLLEELRYYLDD